MNLPSYFIAFFISIVGWFFLFYNALTYYWYKKKYLVSTYKIITYYLIYISIEEFLCNVIGFMMPGKNVFLTHFFFLGNFYFLSVLFYKLLTYKFIKQVIIGNCILISIIVIPRYIIDNNTFLDFNLFETSSISILLIAYAFLYQYSILGKFKKDYYYFTIGLVLFLTCACVIYLSGNLDLVFIQNPLIDVWVLNSIFFIVYQYFIFKELKNIKQLNTVNTPLS